jgi:hypothetical protein
MINGRHDAGESIILDLNDEFIIFIISGLIYIYSLNIKYWMLDLKFDILVYLVL